MPICAAARSWCPRTCKAMAFDVLRHRVLLTFEAEAEDVDADQRDRQDPGGRAACREVRGTRAPDGAEVAGARAPADRRRATCSSRSKGSSCGRGTSSTPSFTGEYRSVFRGQGIEFAEVRDYQQGDDFRAIDWNVSARMGHPFVKTYMEERELTLLLIVDQSGSLHFGRPYTKAGLAVEVAAVLALARGAAQRPRRGAAVLRRARIRRASRQGTRPRARASSATSSPSRPRGAGTNLAGALRLRHEAAAASGDRRRAVRLPRRRLGGAAGPARAPGTKSWRLRSTTRASTTCPTPAGWSSRMRRRASACCVDTSHATDAHPDPRRGRAHAAGAQPQARSRRRRHACRC